LKESTQKTQKEDLDSKDSGLKPVLIKEKKKVLSRNATLEINPISSDEKI